MLKKLFYVVLLLLPAAVILVACGSGVATYPAPNETETFEAALSGETQHDEPTEHEVVPTEPSTSETTEEDTPEPTAVETDDEASPPATVISEASTETESPPPATIEGETAEPTAIETDDEISTLATETSETSTEIATESSPEEGATDSPVATDTSTISSDEAAVASPATAATEPISTSPAEIATIDPTETSEPTEAPTETPLPTDTATPIPTNTATATSTNTPEPTNTPLPTDTATPVPTNTATATSTNTPEPTNTPTSTPSNTPEPTETATPVPTETPEPSNTPTVTPTDTPLPTDTATPVPTNTATATSTNTPEPTNTPTSTPSNTPEPTETATPVPTDTPEPSNTPTVTPTDTPLPTETFTPVPTDTATATSTNTPEPTNTPTATLTNTPVPVELESYENESLGITFDYSPAWNEPIEDDNAIIIIPSEDIEDTSAGNVNILRGTPEEIAEEFIVEVNIDTPETFLESIGEDLEDAEITELELEDSDINGTELIGVAEEDNQTIRAIVIDLEEEWIVIVGIAPTDRFEVFSVEVMDVILQNLDIGEHERAEPVESTQYEGEAVGLEFEYPEDSAIEREGNTLTIDSTIGGVTGNIFIARGTPEDLLEQGHIGDDSNPRAALLSLEPDTDPFVSEQFNPSFQAWTITIEIEDDGETYTQRLYIVAIRTEWVFIRTTALSDEFEEADETIFAPLLKSIIILDEIPE